MSLLTLTAPNLCACMSLLDSMYLDKPCYPYCGSMKLTCLLVWPRLYHQRHYHLFWEAANWVTCWSVVWAWITAGAYWVLILKSLAAVPPPPSFTLYQLPISHTTLFTLGLFFNNMEYIKLKYTHVYICINLYILPFPAYLWFFHLAMELIEWNCMPFQT